MSQENDDLFSMENNEFNDFIKKTKDRDSKVFFIGLLVLILTAAIGYTYLYQGFRAMNEELTSYRLDIADGKKEILTLRETIKSQDADLQSLSDFVQTVKSTEIHSLITFAAQHRKEIDKLKADVQCVKKHNTANPCP